ncbi:hypothetical protein D1872_181450 [compost metagenome]
MELFKTVIDVNGNYLKGSIEPVPVVASLHRTAGVQYKFLGTVTDKEAWTKEELDGLKLETIQVRDKLDELNGPKAVRSEANDPLWK